MFYDIERTRGRYIFHRKVSHFWISNHKPEVDDSANVEALVNRFSMFVHSFRLKDVMIESIHQPPRQTLMHNTMIIADNQFVHLIQQTLQNEERYQCEQPRTDVYAVALFKVQDLAAWPECQTIAKAERAAR